MKIGILTYHFSINCGAVLQCYALQEYYKSKGIPVVVINYVDDNQQDNIELYRKRLNSKNIIKNVLLLPFHQQRKSRLIRFREFQNKFLMCSKKVKNVTELEKLLREERITHIVVGSDQVWNPRIDDFTQAFFLNIKTKCHRVGYAVSLGYATLKDLMPYKQSIEQFEIFSMREKTGQRIISELCGFEPQLTVDPTLLLSESKWNDILKCANNPLKNKRYSVCYFLNRAHYAENFQFARDFSNSKGIPVYTIDYAMHKAVFGHNSLKSCGPLEFLSLIHDAEYVFTDSFHGTVFSLIYQKKFISINNCENNTDTRRSELLDMYGLLSQYISIRDDVNCIENTIYDDRKRDNSQIELSRKFALDAIM